MDWITTWRRGSWLWNLRIRERCMIFRLVDTPLFPIRLDHRRTPPGGHPLREVNPLWYSEYDR